MNGNGTISFYPIPSPPWIFSPSTCYKMIAQVQELMAKLLTTGVAEYTVGSRSVKKFTLKELQDLLAWWQWQLQTAMLGSSMVARRAIPTDT